MVEFLAPAPAGDPIASACRGVHLTRAGCVFMRQRLSRNAAHPCRPCFKHLYQWWSSLHLKPAGVSIASAVGGVCCTRASSVPIASATGGARLIAPKDLPARARAEVHVGGLQSSVRGQSSSTRRGDEVTLFFPRETERRARYRVTARWSQPWSAFQAYCRALGAPGVAGPLLLRRAHRSAHLAFRHSRPGQARGWRRPCG